MWFAGGPVWDDGIVRVQSVGGTRVGMSDGSIYIYRVPRRVLELWRRGKIYLYHVRRGKTS